MSFREPKILTLLSVVALVVSCATLYFSFFHTSDHAVVDVVWVDDEDRSGRDGDEGLYTSLFFSNTGSTTLLISDLRVSVHPRTTDSSGMFFRCGSDIDHSLLPSPLVLKPGDVEELNIKTPLSYSCIESIATTLEAHDFAACEGRPPTRVSDLYPTHAADVYLTISSRFSTHRVSDVIERIASVYLLGDSILGRFAIIPSRDICLHNRSVSRFPIIEM